MILNWDYSRGWTYILLKQSFTLYFSLTLQKSVLEQLWKPNDNV